VGKTPRYCPQHYRPKANPHPRGENGIVDAVVQVGQRSIPTPVGKTDAPGREPASAVRSIPTPVGKTLPKRRTGQAQIGLFPRLVGKTSCYAVYHKVNPRPCGENAPVITYRFSTYGQYPLTVGKTGKSIQSHVARKAHPRACGKLPSRFSRVSVVNPHLRGENEKP